MAADDTQKPQNSSARDVRSAEEEVPRRVSIRQRIDEADRAYEQRRFADNDGEPVTGRENIHLANQHTPLQEQSGPHIITEPGHGDHPDAEEKLEQDAGALARGELNEDARTYAGQNTDPIPPKGGQGNTLSNEHISANGIRHRAPPEQTAHPETISASHNDPAAPTTPTGPDPHQAPHGAHDGGIGDLLAQREADNRAADSALASTPNDTDAMLTPITPEPSFGSTQSQAADAAPPTPPVAPTPEVGVTLVGTPNNDRLNGTNLGDIIDGLGSNDTLYGHGGDDTITGGDNHDNLQGGDGSDTVHGGAGNDAIYGHAGADQLHGGDGNDTIYMDADDTAVTGGDGYDRIIVQGSGGVNVDMTANGIERGNGGIGDDTFNAAGSTERITILGNAGDDTITGGDNHDNLQGGADDDVIIGGAGNDSLQGQAGADQLHGGAGNDTIYADADDTIITGGDGYDRVIVQGISGVTLDMTANSIERVDGGVGNDTLNAAGSTTASVILGNAGDDRITGGDANDNLQGGADDDVIVGGAGNDSLQGQAGADQLHGSAGNDTIYADADDTAITGGDGDDRVIVRGTDGLNLDMTANSVERVDGGVGNDALNAAGSSSATVILGNGGDDTITGGDANDNLQGGAGDDVIVGGAGNDQMRGGTGNDRFNGGAGNDRAYGQDGNDLFVFGQGGGQDRFYGGKGGG